MTIGALRLYRKKKPSRNSYEEREVVFQSSHFFLDILRGGMVVSYIEPMFYQCDLE